jgi:hypothetical protein
MWPRTSRRPVSADPHSGLLATNSEIDSELLSDESSTTRDGILEYGRDRREKNAEDKMVTD